MIFVVQASSIGLFFSSLLSVPFFSEILRSSYLCILYAITPYPYSLTSPRSLPSFAPSGDYHAKVQGVDSNGNLLFCVELDLNL